MSISREKIKFRNRDIKIPISISSSNSRNGQQEDIDQYVREKTGLSINNIIDGEKTPYFLNFSRNFTFKFFFSQLGIYLNNLRVAGFTLDELNKYNENVLNSFFIAETFDTFKSEIQNKLSTNFFSGYDFLNIKNGVNLDQTTYLLNSSNNEFNIQYITNSVITGNTKIYTRYSFYNGKTGKLHIFRYPAANNSGELGNYVEYDLNYNSKNYGNGGVTNIILEEIPYSNNQNYIDRINETLESINVQKPTYPINPIFDPNTGTYISN